MRDVSEKPQGFRGQHIVQISVFKVFLYTLFVSPDEFRGKVTPEKIKNKKETAYIRQPLSKNNIKKQDKLSHSVGMECSCILFVTSPNMT